MNYEEFIKSKQFKIQNKSIDIKRDDLNSNLFDYQKDLVYIALKRGKSAIFAMTGTGKTAMEIEWCRQVSKFTKKPTLILAPLSIAPQTAQESIDIFQKKGTIKWYAINICKAQSDVKDGINITNYDKLHHFDLSTFSGVALDESSILKSFTSSTTETLIRECKDIPFKLCCTATPAPNDFMELGNHCEFLDVMTRTEMLATFFVHDGGETSKWRLKGHAKDKFWEWVAYWAVLFTKPSDLGYPESEDEKYSTPGVEYFEHIVPSKADDGLLFSTNAETLNERRQARRESLNERCSLTADIVNNSDETFIIWCDLNIENDLLKKVIDNNVCVKGSDKEEYKSNTIKDFKDGKIQRLTSKPSMFGFGLNFQICHNHVFTGLSDSFEQIFQAIRRTDRYGQKHKTNVHFVISEAEGNVLKNYKRKQKQFLEMIDELIVFTKKIAIDELQSTRNDTLDYIPTVDMIKPKFINKED